MSKRRATIYTCDWCGADSLDEMVQLTVPKEIPGIALDLLREGDPVVKMDTCSQCMLVTLPPLLAQAVVPHEEKGDEDEESSDVPASSTQVPAVE